MSPIAAVALSVTVVLIFGTPSCPGSSGIAVLDVLQQPVMNTGRFAGEIVPQALCSRYGLQIGSYSAWFVRILIWASWIIAYPISKILDAALGTEHGVGLIYAADPASGCSRCISSQLLPRRSRLGCSFGRACRPAASETSLYKLCMRLGHIGPALENEPAYLHIGSAFASI